MRSNLNAGQRAGLAMICAGLTMLGGVAVIALVALAYLAIRGG